MRRPRLWTAILLYPLALASLPVAIAGGAMWVRSHRVAERWGWGTRITDGADVRLRDVSVWSAKGGVGVYVQEHWNLANGGKGWPLSHETTGTMMTYPYQAVAAAGVKERRYAWGGFVWYRADRGRKDLWMEIDEQRFYLAERSVERTWVVPWWSVAAAGSILPALAARRWARGRRWRRRQREGLCPQCGYDLRATPGRCPECGLEPVRRLPSPGIHPGV